MVDDNCYGLLGLFKIGLNFSFKLKAIVWVKLSFW